MNIQIISDSSCDLTKEEANNLNIKIVPFYVLFDEKTHLKDNVDITCEEFYNTLLNNEKFFPKSAAPNPNDYYDLFLEAVKNDMKVICLCITTKFSSSMQSALIAKEMVLDDYSDAIIEVIDTKINTVAQGLFVEEICKARDNGCTFEQIVEYCNVIRESGRIIFTIGSLNYLAKGGRIGKVSSLVGQGLQLKPIILLEDGEIGIYGITIGRKKSMQKVVDSVRKYFTKKKLNPDEYTFAIGYGAYIDEAIKVRDNIIEMFKEIGYSIKCKVARIGSTIAVHTGPLSIGLGFIKKVSK